MRWERVPVLDEYREDGELVVLLEDGRVLALTPLPAAVLHRLDRDTASADELSDHVVALFGPPSGGSAKDATTQLLEQLSGSGLVRAF